MKCDQQSSCFNTAVETEHPVAQTLEKKRRNSVGSEPGPGGPLRGPESPCGAPGPSGANPKKTPDLFDLLLGTRFGQQKNGTVTKVHLFAIPWPDDPDIIALEIRYTVVTDDYSVAEAAQQNEVFHSKLWEFVKQYWDSLDSTLDTYLDVDELK
eukprot:gene7453-2721_t